MCSMVQVGVFEEFWMLFWMRSHMFGTTLNHQKMFTESGEHLIWESAPPKMHGCIKAFIYIYKPGNTITFKTRLHS